MSSCSFGLAQSHCNCKVFRLTANNSNFFFMNMSEDLLFSLLTLPAVAIPSRSPGCSFFSSSVFRLPAVCHAELIKRCPLAPRDVHHPPLPAPWPWCELSSQLRGGHWDREKPNVKVVVNEKRRVWLFSHYFSARLLVFLFFNALNLHLVVSSSQGFFFPFCDVHMYVALIIASKWPHDVQTSPTKVQN